MEPKIINIPFKREAFKEGQQFRWEIAAKKNRRAYLFYGAISAILLIGGIFQQQDGMPVVAIIGGVMLVMVLIFWSGFVEKKSKFYKLVHQKALQYEDEHMDATYVFSDFGIEYQDKEKMYRLSWRLFKPFTVFQDYIIISIKDANTAMFTLSKNEMKESDYNDVYQILKSHIKEAANRGKVI